METKSSFSVPRERDFTQTKARPAVCLPAASVRDVLLDQLEYLIGHQAGKPCQPGCPECRRLEHAEEWLLLPFRQARHRTTWFQFGTPDKDGAGKRT